MLAHDFGANVHYQTNCYLLIIHTDAAVQTPSYVTPSNLNGKTHGVFCLPPGLSSLVKRHLSLCSFSVFPAATEIEDALIKNNKSRELM